MSRLRTWAGVLVAGCLAMTPGALPQAAASGDAGRYVSGGAAVVRAGGQPVVDEGGAVCDNGDGVGAGGLCLAFGSGDAVRVTDDLTGDEVAFQVCVDNSGDGVCTSPDFGPCADQVFFSHDDAGNFFNPVGPLPTGFATDCPGGPWKGYVVLLCEGVHVADDAHSHPASTGTGEVTTGGEGLGTFCGGGPQPSRKPYKVGSGARYVSGGTAVVRQDGEPAVDEGGVVCNRGDNVGAGGFCTSFGDSDAVAVFDETAGQDVAFQVCIDNSGDGLCTSPDNRPDCPDQVFFSHDDAGNFFNPVGPLPTGFLPGCGASTPWQGYVVFLCEGTHLIGVSGHAHPATSGTGRVASGGEGLGTFCGGYAENPSSKPYVVDLRPPAQFDGGCTLTDGVTADQIVNLTVVATPNGAPDPTASITRASCEVLVNGEGVAVVDAPDGTGVTGTAARAAITSDPTARVDVCVSATVNGVPGTNCANVSLAGVTLPPGVGDAVDAVLAITDAIDTKLSPVTCALLVQLAPVVNATGQTVVYVEPATGDVYVNGTPVGDC